MHPETGGPQTCPDHEQERGASQGADGPERSGVSAHEPVEGGRSRLVGREEDDEALMVYVGELHGPAREAEVAGGGVAHAFDEPRSGRYQPTLCRVASEARESRPIAAASVAMPTSDSHAR